LLQTTETVQHTSAQSNRTFSALILAVIRKTERDRELVPHICSYHMIK